MKDDSAEFLAECRHERAKFVTKYWDRFGSDSPETRVWTENLLIMYDQLMDRLSKLTINKTNETIF